MAELQTDFDGFSLYFLNGYFIVCFLNTPHIYRGGILGPTPYKVDYVDYELYSKEEAA